MHIPLHDLWWLAAGGGAGAGARYMKSRIAAAIRARRRAREPDPTGELLRLHTLYGYNPHALVSIAPGAQLWSTPEIDGAIIYGEFGRVWLAAGDPLAPVDETADLAARFAAFAEKQNRIAAFVPATARFAKLVVPKSFSSVRVGSAPYFDLRNWNPRGDESKKLRAGVNQARRAGVEFCSVSRADDDLRRETAEVCLDWLKSRRAGTTFGWLIALDPFLHAEHKRYFIARANSKLVGFLSASPIPLRKGWYLEDVIGLPDAPKGTATLLVAEALKTLKAEGALLATLGTAPLATDAPNELPRENRVVARTLELASGRLDNFYNFAGLRRFKGKFVPSYWESEYALYPHGATMPPRVGHAIIRALVPGGLSHILTRQALRVLRSKM